MNSERFKYISCLLSAFTLLNYSIFLPVDAMAQQDRTSGPLPAEAVFLTTDRSIYIAGETIYLSATVLETDKFLVSGLSKVIRIELLNCNGKTGIRDLLFSDNGTMAGTLKLPANISTGWYRLRAYTSWMRNVGPSQFSYKDLRIINPSDAGSLNDYTRDDTLSVSVIAGNGTPLTGSLNHCAVRSITLGGRPVAVKGSLVSANKDTVAHFTTGYTGWSTFKWIPEPGVDYYIVMDSDPGIPVVTTVPQHSDRAYTVIISDPLSAGNDPGKDRNLTVTLTGNISETAVKLLVHRVSSWYWFSEASSSNGRLSFVVPTENIPDGLTAFSFLSHDDSTLASILWLKGNPLTGSGSVTTSIVETENKTELMTEYETGERSAKGCFTLITRRCEPVEVSDMYLATLPGWHTTWDIPADRDERSGWLIANAYENNVAESFFMSDEGRPSIPVTNFRDITDKRESLVEFIPETRGVKISGSVTLKNGEPAGFHKLSLTGLNDNLFLATRSYSDGRFHFTLPGRVGSKDLLLSHAMRPTEEMSLSISPEFDLRLSGLPPRSIYLTDQEKIYADQLIIDSRLESIYRDTSLSMPIEGKQKLTNEGMFYGNPDRVIFIDDYIKLPDMREVIFEVVPYVNVRRERDDFSLKVTGETPFPKIYEPLILIDGIPLLKLSRFLELPPDRFERIDVINSLYIHGNQIFAGVVNFISVNRDLAGTDLPEGSRILSIDLPGLPPAGDLVTGNQSFSGIPSLARTLCFIPLSDPDNRTLTCERNPVFGNYITFITGINEEGRWFSSSSRFEIEGSYRNN